MEFFPLTLGVPRPRARRDEEQERRSPATPGPTHEAWREGLSGPEEEFDAHPAEDVLARLVRGIRRCRRGPG